MNDTPSGPKARMSASVLAGGLRRASEADDLWLPVSGSSMGRSISSGSEVRVGPSTRAPAAGEVWAFCTPEGEVLVHRCCSPEGPPYRFRGDAELDEDVPVEAALLIGPVHVSRRDGGPSRTLGARPAGRDAAGRTIRAARRTLARQARRAARRARRHLGR